MGHRANLVLVNNDKYELYYCHWCANTLPFDIFWGIDYAVSFIRKQEKVANTNWLHQVWSEGCVLIDLLNRLILIYGGEDLRRLVPKRQLYLQLLQEAWTGWTVAWAHDGIADLIEYLGLDPTDTDKKVCDELELAGDTVEKINYPKTWADTVVSLILSDNSLRLFPFARNPSYWLCQGTKFVDRVMITEGYGELALHEWQSPSRFLEGGIHIDLPKHQIVFWCADGPRVLYHVSHLWDDWDLVWLKDNYHYQLNHTSDKLTFPIQSTDEMLNELEVTLMRERSSSSKFFLEFIIEQKEAGNNAWINPSALIEHPQIIEKNVKRQILDKIVGKWKRKQA